jgi:hypothetical protein
VDVTPGRLGCILRQHSMQSKLGCTAYARVHVDVHGLVEHAFLLQVSQPVKSYHCMSYGAKFVTIFLSHCGDVVPAGDVSCACRRFSARLSSVAHSLVGVRNCRLQI